MNTSPDNIRRIVAEALDYLSVSKHTQRIVSSASVTDEDRKISHGAAYKGRFQERDVDRWRKWWNIHPLRIGASSAKNSLIRVLIMLLGSVGDAENAGQENAGLSKAALCTIIGRESDNE